MLGVAVFGSHIVQGSFYYDDWANSAHTHEPGGANDFGAALSYFWGFTGFRPLLALYVPVLHEVFGQHWGAHLAWAVVLATLMSGLLFAVLVELGIGRVHALLIAALVLVFPFSDATRLWATSATAHLTASFWLAGLWVALRGLDPGRSRARRCGCTRERSRSTCAGCCSTSCPPR